MSPFWRRFYSALRRVFPACLAQSQAIAFDMFLSCFPTLLMVMGLAYSSAAVQRAWLAAMRPILQISPGAFQIVDVFLTRSGGHAWSFILLGLGGTLLAGTTMMRFIIDGIQMVHCDPEPASFWSRNLRALLLLVTTIAPWLVIANLIVFGKQVRNWMSQNYGLPTLMRGITWVGYVVVLMIFATMVLAVIYRVGRPGTATWKEVLPGAALATLLWWVVSSGFGVYVRYVPYGAVYGGLAAAIALMLWMQLTAAIILVGAAYNAECAQYVEKAPAVEVASAEHGAEVTAAAAGDTLRIDGLRKRN